jgi:hypothetical protein
MARGSVPPASLAEVTGDLKVARRFTTLFDLPERIG